MRVILHFFIWFALNIIECVYFVEYLSSFLLRITRKFSDFFHVVLLSMLTRIDIDVHVWTLWMGVCQRSQLFLRSSDRIFAAIIAMIPLMTMTFTADFLPLSLISPWRTLAFSLESFFNFFSYFKSMFMYLFYVICPIFFVYSVILWRIWAVWMVVRMNGNFFIFILDLFLWLGLNFLDLDWVCVGFWVNHILIFSEVRLLDAYIFLSQMIRLK